MINKRIVGISYRTLSTLVLLWGLLLAYYQVSLWSEYFSPLAFSGADTAQGNIMIHLQDDMEKYRKIYGVYPQIGESCQSILSLTPYFGERVNEREYRNQYVYQRALNSLYPEKSILLAPKALWKFSVSVKEDGSAYVIRAEDRSDPLSGVMHFVARYIVWADQSNKTILSLEKIPASRDGVKLKDIRVTGHVLGCDCTDKNFCVGSSNVVRSQSQ